MGGTSIYATDERKPLRERVQTRTEPAPSWAPRGVSGDLVESLRLAAVRLTGASSPHHIANVVADAAAATLGATSVVVGIRDEPGWHMRLLHDRGVSPPVRQRLPAILSACEEAPSRPDSTALDALAEPLVVPASWDRRRSPSGRAALAALIPPRERSAGIVLVGREHGGPFSPQQRRFLDALAAIAALAFERLGSSSDRRDPAAGSHVQLAGMQIDLADQEVTFDDRHVHLTPSELRLLLFLADEPGRARTRREILQHVWHTEHVGDERACDAHISNLRRKIERDPSRPSRVVTIRNVGYALRIPRIS